MFEGTLAFNQDLSGWDVRNSRNFKFMFKKSGMNHFIGNWRFESMKNVDVLTILVSVGAFDYISFYQCTNQSFLIVLYILVFNVRRNEL